MADIAGAQAAIEQRLQDAFSDPIAFENEDRPDATQPWPPVDADKNPVLWIYCELIDLEPEIAGFGKPGSQTILERGLAKFYVMVAKGSGRKVAREKAVAIGEIFRQAKFYDDTPGAYVRTTTPRIGRDPMISEDGATVAGACCTVPYEFWHRA